MSHCIHIFGASGSGVTTLGKCLGKQLGAQVLDTDSYYWEITDPPFAEKKSPEGRIAAIEKDIHGVENWILSGSLCSWGEPLLHRFSLVVFLYLEPSIRMERIIHWERERFGSRIEPGGDMRDTHVNFIDWARSYDYAKAPTRSLDLHETWMKRLSCPIIRLDSVAPTNELCSQILDTGLHL